MMKKTATAIFQFDLLQSGKAPDWIQLFPEGPEIVACDGRRWLLNDEDKENILSNFKANSGPLVIDCEHGQAHFASGGLLAPASGWIEELEFRDGQGLWGCVSWTEVAAAQIVAREYHFISSEFTHNNAGHIFSIDGAGLLNRPAFKMTALSCEEKSKQEKQTMDLKAIAAALLLDESAGPSRVALAAAAYQDELCAKGINISISAAIDHVNANPDEFLNKR